MIAGTTATGYIRTASILTELGRRGIRLRAEGDKPSPRPLSAVSRELREAARQHKTTLLALLSEHPSGAGVFICQYELCAAR